MRKPFKRSQLESSFKRNTLLSVAPIFSHGLSGPGVQIGPYIILKHIDHGGSISDKLALWNPEFADASNRLDPEIPINILKRFYSKISVQCLYLFEPSFSKIGALGLTDGDPFQVTGRPITQNTCNFLQLAHIPATTFPPKNKTYKTANEYYVALVEMHIIQFTFQHNELVKSVDDCWNKYVARQPFLSLAKQGRLSTFRFFEDDWSFQSKSQSNSELSPAPDSSSNFKLWCDDLRPSNILLSKTDDILALID